MLHMQGGLYTGFCQGGQTWSMSKREGARLFVAAGQPQGGGGIQGGGENNSRVGKCPPPKYTLHMYI